MTPRNLTTAEAAARIGISARMLRHHVKHARITPAERIGPLMMFRPADVDDLAGRIERRTRIRETAA